jgi:hypothetical protein
MPRRPRADRLLEDALAALVRALRRSKASWMVIGGIAVVARGVRRFTTDIGAAVSAEDVDVARLLSLLEREDIIPRIEDAETFARANLVLLLEHQPTRVELDLSLAWSAFEQAAIAAASSCRFGRVTAPMARAEDLLVFKGIAGRPKDLEDIETLLALHPSLDAEHARARLAPLVELAEAPELLDGFDQAVARARPRSAAAPRAKTRTMNAKSPRRK